MDPEERDELLREVDEELDEELGDTPKGRAIKEVLKSLTVNKRSEQDREVQPGSSGAKNST